MQDSDYCNRPDAKGYGKVIEALRRWDPLGVYASDHAGPPDEYNDYVMPIVQLLDRGASADELAAVLRKFARDDMGMRPAAGRADEIATELVAFWKEWKSEL